MSHSVLVLSNGAELVQDGIFKTANMPGPLLFGAEALFLDMIAKEEPGANGVVTIYLNDNFCALSRTDGYAVYICIGEFHISEPLLVLPLDSVIRTEGNHELECHHKDLPIM